MKVYKKGATTRYQGVTYRSRYEVYVKKLLDASGFAALYEPQRFFFGNKLSYLPDYLVPSLGCWLEVKGLLSYKDKVLMHLFSQENKLIYLGKDQLKEIHGKKSMNLISSPDIVNYNPTKAEVRRFKRMLQQ